MEYQKKNREKNSILVKYLSICFLIDSHQSKNKN